MILYRDPLNPYQGQIEHARAFELINNSFEVSAPETGLLSIIGMEILGSLEFPISLYVCRKIEKEINVVHVEIIDYEGTTFFRKGERVFIPYPQSLLIKIDRGSLKGKIIYRECAETKVLKRKYNLRKENII